MIRLAFALVLVLVASRAHGQSFQFGAPDLTVQVGSTVPTTFVAGFTIEQTSLPVLETSGFAMGVAHDPSVLSVESIDYGAGVISDQWGEPDIFITNAYEGGWSCGVIFAHLGNWSVEFPVPLVAIDVTYSTSNPLPTPATTDLTWSNQLGTPPVQNVVVVFGVSHSPQYVDGGITLAPIEFIRGDMNGDGGINIADIFTAEEYLFLGGETPGCLAALDANHDGAIDIGDIIYELSYLFLGGDPMAAPFPACGPMPTDSEVSCDESQCAP